MANSYLSRTPSSAGSTTTGTFSFWVKRSLITSDMYLWTNFANSTNWSAIGINNVDQVYFYAESGGSAVANLKTNRVFRDPSAWYHIVVAVDSTNGTADDRVKIYINGKQETSFVQRTNPSSSADLGISETVPMEIGRYGGGSAYFDGYISHAAFVDGQALAPTVFGETDSTSGIWKFKSPSGITWGTNGVHLKFENSGALGTDSSGNSNTFTVNGNLKQALDTPSNVYATLNPLNVPTSNAPTFSNGNTQSVSSSSVSGAFGGSSTIGVSSGKWYMEAKCLTSGHTQSAVGVTYNDAETARTNNGGTDSYEYSYRMNGNKGHDNTDSSYGDTYTTNDIIGIALDLDNNKIYFSKNGTWQNSGDPTSGATGTGAAFTVDSGETYMFYHHDTTGATSNTSTFAFNFGNGYFGTTAITSAGSNGNGSLFEYDVPSGYYALNTKNLAEYG